ncbi:MAG: DUF11 domain-containing protein, partial [Acidimicrobiia bacterium]|nr:DUF11 domain-containing protein [Acidimicrobiia bacterium]
VTETSGAVAWTPVNNGTDTNLIIEGAPGGIDIPAGGQVELLVTVVLEDTSGNFAGVTFTNTADYTYNFTDDDDTSELDGDPGTSPPMTIVEPNLTMAKTGPAAMVIGTPDVFTLDLQNAGDSPAHELTISDRFPDGATGGMCDIAPTPLTARVFQSDGVTPVSAPLVAGADYSVVFAPAPTCLWTLTFTTPQTVIGAGERLILTYETELDVDTQAATSLMNVAGATRWFSTDGSDPQTAGDRHTYIEVLTDGTAGTVDHEDEHTVTTGLPDYFFEKTVVVPGTTTPITTASPGDTLRYRLRLENNGGTTLSDLGFTDEIDALNAPAVFVPGSFTLFSSPAGADTSGTDPNGGANGTGVIDVRGMTALPGEVLLVEFDVTLLPVIANGTNATNQSQLLVNDLPFADSDDPNVGGQASSAIAGDEDPTVVLIQSAPDFLIEKTSAYITGDPTVLLAGETLRYTITVKNIGTDHAIDAMLRDAIPANTAYVPDSTTLNGAAVPDAAGGVSPLAAGILINAPEDPTPGAMRADSDPGANNTATLVFDVVVDPNVIDGTVISNQAFVSAPTHNVFDQPSDDPRTPTPDDPTQDVVGNVPLLFAPKSVALVIDNGVIGQIDPGDRLEYTITVFNNSVTPATNAILTDTPPNDTTYVADSTTLNGAPVGVPDGGTLPLIAGLPIASSDQPAPGPTGGTLSPGESAVVTFLVDVDAGTPSGTVISNQATVGTDELDVLTDGDGDPGTGP